jgi:AcrR family transcriptional regulator
MTESADDQATGSSARRGPGRPRSDAAEAAVLDATMALLRETPVGQLTIEAIAREAGVGKPTIYRRWPNKNAVVVEAAFRSVAEQLEVPVTGTVLDALLARVDTAVSLMNSRVGQVLAELIGEGQSDPETLASVNERFMRVRRDSTARLIERGKQSGEFDPAIDVELALDLIYGPLYYRLLVGHLPLDSAFARDAVSWVMRGIGPASRGSAAGTRA